MYEGGWAAPYAKDGQEGGRARPAASVAVRTRVTAGMVPSARRLALPALPSGPMPPPARKARSAVFVTYNGLLDPLGSSQILPYLERLHASWPVHILSFERPGPLGKPGAVAEMEARLRRQGIAWTRRRYHKFPSLPATSWDVLQGVRALRRILASEDVGLVHARGYIPATIALRATRRHPMLFDIRGLQAEEYVDGGVWKEGGLKYRLAKRAENEMFARAAGAVVLTKAIAPYVAGPLRGAGTQPADGDHPLLCRPGGVRLRPRPARRAADAPRGRPRDGPLRVHGKPRHVVPAGGDGALRADLPRGHGPRRAPALAPQQRRPRSPDRRAARRASPRTRSRC